jgi:long-chain fatty acid transport protein
MLISIYTIFIYRLNTTYFNSNNCEICSIKFNFSICKIFKQYSSMKRTLLLSVIFFIFGTVTMIAQMDNLSNMSAKWIMSNTRNAATDGADIVNYNPAGVVRLSDGLHINLSNQTMIRKPEHSFNLGLGEKKYGQDGIDPFLPNLYLSYKKDNWAVSSGTYISGGGATANYPDGSFNTTVLGYSMLGTSTSAIYTSVSDMSLKASSFYLTVPVTFSYALNDKISVAAGARYIRGINKTEAGLTLAGSLLGASDLAVNVDYKENATGFGGVVGVFYQPTDKLNLSVHYETGVKLDFEAKDNKGNYAISVDGKKNRRDLPAALCTGASYRISDKLTAAADFNYYFQTSADWGKITNPKNGLKVDASDVAGNCYTAGLGLSYFIIPELQLSAGCKYTAFLYDDQQLYYTKLGLYEVVKYNNLNFGLGASYKISDKFQIDLGMGRTFWKDKDINTILTSPNIPVSITDKGYVVAIGIELSL